MTLGGQVGLSEEQGFWEGVHVTPGAAGVLKGSFHLPFSRADIAYKCDVGLLDQDDRAWPQLLPWGLLAAWNG